MFIVLWNFRININYFLKSFNFNYFTFDLSYDFFCDVSVDLWKFEGFILNKLCKILVSILSY